MRTAEAVSPMPGLKWSLLSIVLGIGSWLLMEMIQGLADLNHVAKSVTFHFLVLKVDQQRQTDAFNELHDEKHFIVKRPAKLVSLHNVRMVKRQSDFAFRRLMQSLKTSFEFGCLFFVQNLESHLSAGLQVGCFPDLGHTSLPHSPDQIEAFGDVRFFVRLLFAKQLVKHGECL